MPLFQQSFPILDNPISDYITAGQGMQQMASNNIANNVAAQQSNYVGPQLQQQLLASQLANKQLMATLPAAGPKAWADVALAQGQASEAGQRGSLFGAQANLIAGQTPAQIQQAYNDMYSDPSIRRAIQLRNSAGIPLSSSLSGYANGAPIQDNSGAAPANPQSLASLGFGNVAPSQLPAVAQDIQSAVNRPMLPGGINPAQQPQIQQGVGTGPSMGQQPISQSGVTNAPLTVTPTTAPKLFSGTPAQNFVMFGSPYNPIQLAQLQAQAKATGETGVNTWNATLKDAASASDAATLAKNYVNQFSDAYNKSTYTGPVMGMVPTKGYGASIPAAFGHDFTPEQLADNAANNIKTALAPALFKGHVTNMDFGMLDSLKLNRTMTPQAKTDVTNYMEAQENRTNEMQQMLETAKQQGLDPQTAQTLVSLYNQQRPVYDWTEHQPNDNFAGSWPDYLKPDVISAVQSGQRPIVAPAGFRDKQQQADWNTAVSLNSAPSNQQAPAQGAGQPQGNVANTQFQATKNLNGNTYHKINGQWYQA